MKYYTSKEVGESREVGYTPESAWDKMTMYRDKNKEDYHWVIIGTAAKSSQAIYTWVKNDE